MVNVYMDIYAYLRRPNERMNITWITREIGKLRATGQGKGKKHSTSGLSSSGA